MDLRTAVDLRIRIVVTRGPGGLAVPMASAGPGHTIVIAEPIAPSVAPDVVPETSLALVDWALPRRAGRGHKTLAYLDHVIAKELARERGADDAVRLDADGRVAEGGTCNVFAVRDGIVYAPTRGALDARGGAIDARGSTIEVAPFAPGGEAAASGVLPGVTAARVVAICRRADIAVVIGPIEVAAFFEADEIFVTSAVRGVVAVTRIVSDGERVLPVGVLTSRIRAAYVGEMTSL